MGEDCSHEPVNKRVSRSLSNIFKGKAKREKKKRESVGGLAVNNETYQPGSTTSTHSTHSDDYELYDGQ